MLKRHESILEGFRDFLDKNARPAPLADEHPISKASERLLIFNEAHHGLSRVRSGAALGFLGRVVHEDLFKHAQEGMERVISSVAKASKIEADPRFRREEAEKFLGLERGKVVHPELDNVARVVAMAVSEKLKALEGFKSRVLELSAPKAPAGADETMAAMLTAREIRDIARAIHEKKGAVGVDAFIREALDAERFDVVAAVEAAFPVLIAPDALRSSRMAWAKQRYPEIAGVEEALQMQVFGVYKAGSEVLGLCRVAADRQTGEQDYSWNTPKDVMTAFELARPAIEAGEAAVKKFEHAQALSGKASEGNK